MATVADVFSTLFYAAMLASLGFFVHKVLWLVQYKKLQGALVRDAVADLARGHDTTLVEWNDFVGERWREATGSDAAEGPAAFVRSVEDELTVLRRDMKAGRRSIEDLLGKALADAGKDAPARATVLSLRRPGGGETGARIEVTLDVDFPPVAAPRRPDQTLYELRVRSRYGLLRRALVFFSGAADVVYSSQHVARMSQNIHLPTSVLVRRLSLVLLILGVVVVDLVFGVKHWLAGVIEAWIHGPGGHAAKDADFLSQNLGAILAFGLWMAAYGVIYLLVYALIRRRYQVSVRRLGAMRAAETTAMKEIWREHVGELVRWGREYGRSLDSAVEITLRHADTLVDHQAHRLRRRVAPAALLDGAKAIADSLFLRLPESRGDVRDVATQQRHSLRHYVWPRPEEMAYQARFAQYRAVWQELELAVADLRGERPDPRRAEALWRSAVVYATVFAPLIPSGTAEELRHAYAQMVAECVTQTERDLAELDRRLGELQRTLGDQLEAARGLLVSKVDLANQKVQAAAAALSAELIHVREQARLEAMAFEI